MVHIDGSTVPGPLEVLTLKCPVCKVPTFGVEYLKIEIDLCPECNGVWFDRGELELLLGRGRALPSAIAETSEELRPCPLCPRRMEKVNIGPERRVLIDACPGGCGLWFDNNEIIDLTNDLQDDGWLLSPELRAFLGGIFPQ